MQGEQGNRETTRTGQKQTVTRIDQRMQQLFFQYDDVRTNDNIEFEGAKLPNISSLTSSLMLSRNSATMVPRQSRVRSSGRSRTSLSW